jgi:GNAT superfamily N-acetyltransferase
MSHTQLKPAEDSMSSQLAVRPVTTDAEHQAFLKMPWKVYKDDPNWTAPIWSEHVKFFDSARNPELGHIEMQKYVAWRGDEPVGTIIALVNRAYNDYHKENVGWFGQFELINDPEVGAALLGSAEEWLRAKGVSKMMGPATYSTNSEIGLLVQGHDTPSMILMPYHKAYYQCFVEDCGMVKHIDLWAWWLDAEAMKKNPEQPMERFGRLAAKIRQRRNYTVRTVDMKHFDKEVEHVKRLYNEAWAKNWGFIPLNDGEIDALAEGMKAMLDPNIVVVVEVKGEVVGFAIPVPDVFQPMRKAKMKPGEPEFWQLLKLIWHWKIAGKIDRVRVWGMGVVEEHRGTGIDAVMYYEMLARALPRGYRHIEMSWILETNDMMNRPIVNVGGEVYKTYRVYEKAF